MADAIVMRITQAGVYVQILKYGSEGLITPESVEAKAVKDELKCVKILTDTQKELATLKLVDS